MDNTIRRIESELRVLKGRVAVLEQDKQARDAREKEEQRRADWEDNLYYEILDGETRG